ncbi:ATP phosphoribosyltransferase regulatory subunit [Oceanobacillus senegalensis]|uniref:ATP phosphoribosyltransferase regulatory subunit n=1 Tax=Oceanobacillus senegalensis TaxID=1936063 RepID=UPI000A314533|nr:ATP phosphoribosyltransferase regulatory subunit [Oceanobacillus senegalensis]
MQRYVIDINKNTNVEDFQIRDEVISTLKKRFITYGFKQVRTSTFESYDMYSDITGTVNKDEMIKVIDTSGKVLVLRPDVTIPLHRMTSLNKTTDSQRLFYVLDVFRQSQEQENHKESTQAGVECFGQNSTLVDSEIIMMAIHTFQDLGFQNFKLEIGHAGFFKELVQQTNLTEDELESLQSLIQSKNLVEIEPFLSQLEIDEDVKTALQSIPMMYGDPQHVINQAKDMIRNESMQRILQNLIEIYEGLQAYGAENSVVFNLGLINNMNYYSGVIFQGFVDSIGKPVLMGGRYDNLGQQLEQSIPAIGFAFEVDLLVHAMQQQGMAINSLPTMDVIIRYVKEKQKEALRIAYLLRDSGFHVLTHPLESSEEYQVNSLYTIVFDTNQNRLSSKKTEQIFTDQEEVFAMLQEGN